MSDEFKISFQRINHVTVAVPVGEEVKCVRSMVEFWA
jgi:hypothetical protein